MKRGTEIEQALKARTEEIDSDFRPPPLRATVESVVAHFRAREGGALPPMRNPHHEARVSDEERRVARPAAVLVPLVRHAERPTLLLTRRHEDIAFGGHVCFPGGGCESSDSGAEATALREAEEEIGLVPDTVQLLGRLGDYVTHSGFRITPVVGVVTPPLDLLPRPGEVDAILEIPLDHVLQPDSYRLRRHAHLGRPRANFYLEFEEWVVAGPTVSLLMGLYEQLLETHDAC
jgi:8-oxo-dGTP pyrophosphatase MutT (NUDIX family)